MGITWSQVLPPWEETKQECEDEGFLSQEKSFF